MSLLFAGIASQGCSDAANPNPTGDDLPSDAQGAYDLAITDVKVDLGARASTPPELAPSASLTNALHIDLSQAKGAWSATVSSLWGPATAYDVTFTKESVKLTPHDTTANGVVVNGPFTSSAVSNGVLLKGRDFERWTTLELRRDVYGTLAGTFTATGELSHLTPTGQEIYPESSLGTLARDAHKPQFAVSVTSNSVRTVHLPWDQVVAHSSEPLDTGAFQNAVSLVDATSAKTKRVALTTAFTDDPLRSTVSMSIKDWSKLPAKTRARIAPVADASVNVAAGIEEPIEWLAVPEPKAQHTFESSTVAFWGNAARAWDARVCERGACAVVGPFTYSDEPLQKTDGVAARVTLGEQSKVVVRYRVLAGSAPTQLGAAAETPRHLGDFETAIADVRTLPVAIVVGNDALVADASLPAPFTRATEWKTIELAVESGAGKEAGFAVTANLSALAPIVGTDRTPIPFEIVVGSITGK